MQRWTAALAPNTAVRTLKRDQGKFKFTAQHATVCIFFITNQIKTATTNKKGLFSVPFHRGEQYSISFDGQQLVKAYRKQLFL